jgi:polysaccharide pyruvyl transferase WcaK-like protein
MLAAIGLWADPVVSRKKANMRILVEPSDYVLRNMGDMAMLRTAVSRLASLWPNAVIQILTDEPEALRRFCPEATPLSSGGRRQWLSNGFLPHRFRNYVSPQQLRSRVPELIEILWRHKLRHQHEARRRLIEFTQAVSSADLIIVTGMGGITDAFPEYAAEVLETLRLAVRYRKYVAMVGQAFGPLELPDLVSRARAVLPSIDFIALREERASLPLLQSLGVARHRITITGDDAIEMAYQLRSDRLGEGLGINMRASNYSGVGASLLEPLREVLRKVVEKYRVPMIPIPISRVPGESDAETVKYLLDGYQEDSPADLMLDRPEAVICQIQRCRLVITGSYHAGVFALATGTPTIGLAKSAYYVDKFMGLSALFGDGCETVLLSEQDFCLSLEASITKLWGSADRLRPGLLEEARRQIKLGQISYERLRTEVEAGRRNLKKWRAKMWRNATP